MFQYSLDVRQIKIKKREERWGTESCGVINLVVFLYAILVWGKEKNERKKTRSRIGIGGGQLRPELFLFYFLLCKFKAQRTGTLYTIKGKCALMSTFSFILSYGKIEIYSRNKIQYKFRPPQYSKGR